MPKRSSWSEGGARAEELKLALKVDWILLVNSLSSSQDGGNEVAVALAVGA